MSEHRESDQRMTQQDWARAFEAWRVREWEPWLAERNARLAGLGDTAIVGDGADRSRSLER